MKQKPDAFIIIPAAIVFSYYAIVIIFGFAYIGAISAKSVFLYLIASPVMEELIFRGFVQKKIAGFLKNKIFFLSLSNIAASILFASAHFLARDFAMTALLTFFPSLFLGFIYERKQNIAYPIFFHSVFNLNAFIVYCRLLV